MTNQKDLSEQGIFKCGKCGLIGNESNMTYFEDNKIYIHDKCIEKIINKNPIDILLDLREKSNGNPSKEWRTPKHDNRLLKLLINHYKKSKHLLKWDHINEKWDEVL